VNALNNDLLPMSKNFDFSFGSLGYAFARLPIRGAVEHRHPRRVGATAKECARGQVQPCRPHDFGHEMRIINIAVDAAKPAEQQTGIEGVRSNI
jgi:hypothetical protein